MRRREGVKQCSNVATVYSRTIITAASQSAPGLPLPPKNCPPLDVVYPRRQPGVRYKGCLE